MCQRRKRAAAAMAAALLGCSLLSAAACRRQENPPAVPPLPAAGAPAPAAPPGAPGVTVPPLPAAGPVAGSDRAFVAEAAASGMAEIEAGRYVAARTKAPKVREFAQRLEREHAAADEELQRIAAGKGIALPGAIEGEPAMRLQRLKSLPADGLEREFLQSFGVELHTGAIALFEREAREGQDPELRGYAEQTLPKLREHQGMAQQLQGERAGGV